MEQIIALINYNNCNIHLHLHLHTHQTHVYTRFFAPFFQSRIAFQPQLGYTLRRKFKVDEMFWKALARTKFYILYARIRDCNVVDPNFATRLFADVRFTHNVI